MKTDRMYRQSLRKVEDVVDPLDLGPSNNNRIINDNNITTTNNNNTITTTTTNNNHTTTVPEDAVDPLDLDSVLQY